MAFRVDDPMHRPAMPDDVQLAGLILAEGGDLEAG
jgi:hypothetical protein